MDQFNLETQYNLYLSRVGLHEDKMHTQQKKQLREAFYGACGQILILLKDELSKLEEDKAVEVMESMIQQITTFFLQGRKN